MIELKDISFQYPQSEFELKISELSIQAGSKTAIIGPSGFGKTTLLNLIAGILTPDLGTITIGENMVQSLSDSDRRKFRIQNIGFIFQDFRLIPYLNIYDNILLPYRINQNLKLSKSSRANTIKLADELGIGELIKKYPDQLSHGERQRVAIARALINKPQLLLADEPTGNLDPANKQHIKKMLFNAVETQNATLIAVTHDHEMLEGFDHVIDFKTMNIKSVNS